jgi:hypothetical protein
MFTIPLSDIWQVDMPSCGKTKSQKETKQT